MLGNLFGKKSEDIKTEIGEERFNKNLEILRNILGDDPHPQAVKNDEYLDADLRNDFILYCEGKHVNRDPAEFAKFMPELK